MNDDFLHRIRKAPPPEFLSRLEARLDGQSLTPAPRRRWPFTRGLITGLLLGATAFALTAVSLTRGPESLRALVRTPAAYFARLLSGQGTERGEAQDQAHGQGKAMPLGPVWLPDHAQTPVQGESVPTQSTGFAVKQQGASTPVASRAPGAPAPGAAEFGGPAGPLTIRIAAASDAYPIAVVMAERASRPGFKVNVELDAGDALDRLCTTDSNTRIDAVELPRRITPEEFRRCTRGGNKLVEVKLGYLAIVLARAPLYGALHLTARDLFLALARRIPDPAHPDKLIDNPNTTWNQVDGSLPYDRIQVLGPAPDSTAGKLVAHLLLQGGCNTYQSILAIRASDPEGYENICASLRTDGAYAQSELFGEGGTNWAYSDLFVINPTQLGVFRVNDPGRSRNNLVVNSVDATESAALGLAAGSYSVAKTLYVYINKARFFRAQPFMAFVNANMQRSVYIMERDTWAFVPLDTAEMSSSLANATALKELQF
ncbi:MAG TPA: substrate-binding domain-containing protein [Steroidobacteraceae bacterium]